jgi:hypothetical protein
MAKEVVRSLERSCKKGVLKIEEFIELLGTGVRRTHFLEVGDYALSVRFNNDVIITDRIAKLNSPEKGDFLTVRGATGPISGNVFIKINKKDFPKYLLIEGDKIGEPGCPTPVYDLVNEYIKSRSELSLS